MANNYEPKYNERCIYCGIRVAVPTWKVCDSEVCRKAHSKAKEQKRNKCTS